MDMGMEWTELGGVEWLKFILILVIYVVGVLRNKDELFI
jgi:hypothetical protein